MHSCRVGWQISTQGDAVRCTWLISSDSPFDSEWVYCIWIFTECFIHFLSFYEHSSSDTMFFITSFLLGWQLTLETKKLQIKIWWMTATERNLLCMTNSSMSRNAVVVSEVVKKMHIRSNESYKGGSNPPSIF